MEGIRGLSKKLLWEAVVSCNEAYDLKFFYGVKTTKIFCRPSCKSKTPKYENVRFFASANAAQELGYRACKRCRPDLVIDILPLETTIQKTKQFIEEHSEEHLLLNEIASEVGVSPFYLTRTFKDYTGYTPRSYLEKIRIENAKHLLLTTQMSIIAIGFKVGFQSISSFYNAFKGITKLSPNEYKSAFKARTTP